MAYLTKPTYLRYLAKPCRDDNNAMKVLINMSPPAPAILLDGTNALLNVELCGTAKILDRSALPSKHD